MIIPVAGSFLGQSLYRTKTSAAKIRKSNGATALQVAVEDGTMMTFKHPMEPGFSIHPARKQQPNHVHPMRRAPFDHQDADPLFAAAQQ